MTRPNHPRARLTTWALVPLAALSLLLTACTGKPAAPSVTPPATTSPSPSVDPAEAQNTAKVLALYDNFNKALVTWQAKSDVNKANDELPKYTVDPLKTQLLLDLRQRSLAGLHNTGQPTWTAKVSKINVTKTPFTATIESCYDATNYQLVDSKGKPAGVPGQAKKYVVTATAEQYGDGNWYLQTSAADRGRTC